MRPDATTRDAVRCAVRARVEHFSHASGRVVGLRTRPDPDTALLASQRRTLDLWIVEAVDHASRGTGSTRGVTVRCDVNAWTVTGDIVLYPALGSTWLHGAIQSVATMFGFLGPTKLFVEPFVVADVVLDIRADRTEMNRVLGTVRTALSREGRLVAFEPSYGEVDAAQGAA